MIINKSNLNLGILIVVTIMYIATLFAFLIELVESCITEIFLNRTSADVIRIIIDEPRFYAYIAGILLILYLMTRALITLFIFCLSIIKTRLFIKKLFIKKEMAGFTLFKSINKNAFTAGFIFPKTYISDSLVENVSKKTLNQIISHEKNHAKNRDPLKLLIFTTLLQILPPFLFKKEIINDFIRDAENSAQINSEYLFQIDKISKKLAISNYGGNLEEELFNNNGFYKSWFSLVMCLFSFIFLFAISGFTQSNPLSACSNPSTCLSIGNAESLNNMPSQCIETLYSPAYNYSKPVHRVK